MITSSTCPGSTPARFTDSATTFAPSSGAVSDESPPRNLPIGVRTAPKITAFSMIVSGENPAPHPKFQYRRAIQAGQFWEGYADSTAKKGPPLLPVVVTRSGRQIFGG